MSDSNQKDPALFKVLKGTIVKIHGYPAKLLNSVEVTCLDGESLVGNIKIVGDEDYFDRPSKTGEKK